MAKRKRKTIGADQWADVQARSERTLRLLQERIDFHQARLREQYGPDYRFPTLEERIAYHAARLREAG